MASSNVQMGKLRFTSFLDLPMSQMRKKITELGLKAGPCHSTVTLGSWCLCQEPQSFQQAKARSSLSLALLSSRKTFFWFLKSTSVSIFLCHLGFVFLIDSNMSPKLNLEFPRQYDHICAGVHWATGYFWRVWMSFYKKTIFKDRVARARGQRKPMCRFSKMRQDRTDSGGIRRTLELWVPSGHWPLTTSLWELQTCHCTEVATPAGDGGEEKKGGKGQRCQEQIP